MLRPSTYPQYIYMYNRKRQQKDDTILFDFMEAYDEIFHQCL